MSSEGKEKRKNETKSKVGTGEPGAGAWQAPTAAPGVVVL